ncbi:MAG: hypothetical protein OXC37_02750 [Bdellovibrionaceae bacterium]|nr:hypothetical protein [Pseudobdellovibrionaceae bacterium]
MFIKKYFVCFIIYFFLTSCDSPSNVSSIFPKDSLTLFNSKTDNSGKKDILELSDQIYSGSERCSFNSDCKDLCDEMYSLSNNQDTCEEFKFQQISQLEKLYGLFFEKSFEPVNVFDLKVAFYVSSEYLFEIFKSLDLFYSKKILTWISLNWDIANIFKEEDNMFQFLRLFLKKISDTPINSLKEPILEERTFVELAWLKQNDFALLWLYDYFKEEECKDIEKLELDNCGLAKYCLISESFNEDVSKEFMEFKHVKDLTGEESRQYNNFKSFCLEFCSSGKGKNYC